MKILLITGAFLAAVLIQIVCGDLIPVCGVQPDFVLIAVVFFCLRAGWQKGIMLGMIAGFIMDMFSVGRVGLFTVSFGACGFFLGLFTRKLYFENPLTQSLIVFLFTFINASIYAVLSVTFNGVSLWNIFARKTMPLSLYNFVVSLLIFILLRRFERKRLLSV